MRFQLSKIDLMFHNFFSKLNKTETETMAVINETYLFGSSTCQESFAKLKEMI